VKAQADRVVRKRLADGSVKEYRYPRYTPRVSRNAEGSVGALIEAYRRSAEWAGLRKTTKYHYGMYLDVLAGLSEQPVSALRRRHVLTLRDALAGTRGPAAATKFVRVTSSLLTWAVEREWIEVNPLSRVKALTGGHLRAWTAAEYDLVLPHLVEPLRRVAVLARYTGQRRSDLTGMVWSQYDGTTLRLVQGKTRAALVIPAAPDLRAELDAWKRGATSAQILTTDRGLPWRGAYLSRRIAEAVAGIDPSLRGLNVHGFRKLAATSLAEAGCSTHEIAAITGHRTLAMVALYTASARQEQLAGSAITRLETARQLLSDKRRQPID
jgi:integrase